MFDAHVLILIAGIFLLAGTVKGVIGMGLPTVSLGLLTATLDLQTAVALVAIPPLILNLYQAGFGGHMRTILRRIWPFLVMAVATVWFGTHALARIDPERLKIVLGVVLTIYGAISLAGFRLTVSPRHEVWAGPVVGGVTGVINGMTGSTIVPGVLFLQAIGLSKDALIQAMGLLFVASAAALVLALQSNHLLTGKLALTSAMAVVPALAGMLAGQAVRKRLSETWFRRVFFAAMLVLGGYIVVTALI